MTLLRKATNQTAYLKAGIMGFAGSGKTFTAAQIAIGLSQRIGDRKPVAFFDTETGSDFLIPRFNEAGIELLVAKTRSFADLLTFMREAEGTCSVAIIDSISHVWNELRDAYQERLRRKYGLQFEDWAKVKKEWQQFTDAYLNSKMHVVLCGRAGYEYEYEKDAETGKKELIKTGTKMKAEGEMSYEPSLLIEMLRLKKSETTGDHDAKGWTNRAVVLKDRWDIMNGTEIDSPTFQSFWPAIAPLNIGGEHLGVDTSRTSQDLFESPDSLIERKKRVDITLELIQDAMIEAGISGTSKDAKAAQVKYLKDAFGTSSWTAISSMKLELLENGYALIRRLLAPLRGETPEPEPAYDEAAAGAAIRGEQPDDGLRF